MAIKTTKRAKKSRAKRKSLDAYIVVTPGFCGGRPRIAGHRIAVAHIVVWHDRMGMTADQIADQHGLSLAEIHAALAYYFTHREQIDQRMREDAQFVKEFFEKNRSPLQEKLAKLGITHDLDD